MSEPVVYKGAFWASVLTVLRAIAPVAVALLVLRLLASVFDVDFGDRFMALAIVVAALGGIILQPSRDTLSQLAPRGVALAGQMLLRWIILIFVLLTIGYATKLSADFSRRVVIGWMFITPIVMLPVTIILDELLRRVSLSLTTPRAVVFAGFNETSRQVAERLRKNPSLNMRVVGFFDDRSSERLGMDESNVLIGGLTALPDFVRTQNVDMIFIALPMRHIQRVLDLLDGLRDTTASIYYVPDIFVMDLIQSRTLDILGIPAIAMCETPFYGYRGVSKRIMDVALSSLALLLLSPLMLIVALLVKLTSPGPVIFKQRRYGLDGLEIHVFKFRTMTVIEDGPTIRQARKDDDRFTPIGRILRRLSIDELPQLFNVLQGSMSLVGPRPHAVAHNEEYRKLIKGYMVRHKVLPGITGLAQVSGCRGETSKLEEMEARIRFDLDYLRHWSLGLDLKILWRTVMLLFRDAKAY